MDGVDLGRAHSSFDERQADRIRELEQEVDQLQSEVEKYQRAYAMAKACDPSPRPCLRDCWGCLFPPEGV